MKIGIAIQNNFPADAEVRARKTAKLLHNRGHKAVIFGRVDGRGRKKMVDYATVERFNGHWAGPFSEVATSSVPINPIWFGWLFERFQKADLDAVVASNLRAGLPAICAARVLGIPAVLDLQENNPEAVKTRGKDSLVHHFTRDPSVVRSLEKLCISLASQVWVVVEERRQQLANSGVPQKKLNVVSNTPYLREVEYFATLEKKSPWAFTDEKTTLAYVGTINELRGLDIVVESVPHLLENSTEIEVAIAGDGPYRSVLQRRVKQLGVEDYVRFEGWVNANQVPQFLAAADIGVIPHHVNGFTNTTVPNKLFDYMQAGLPVLASEMDPVARILRKENCGKTFQSGASSEDFAQILRELIESDLSILAENGRTAIERRYNWEQEADTILRSLRNDNP